MYLLLLLLLLLLWILLLAASLRESCNPCLGGSVSSVLIAFRGPCSAPMDPLQRRRRGATGWVLGAGHMARGTGGLAPALPPIQHQPPSNKQALSAHGDTAGWPRQITHLRTCTSSHTPRLKVPAWVRGFVFTGPLKILHSPNALL